MRCCCDGEMLLLCQAMDDDESRAVRSSLEALESLRAIAGPDGTKLSVAIGITTGRVFCGEARTILPMRAPSPHVTRCHRPPPPHTPTAAQRGTALITPAAAPSRTPLLHSSRGAIQTQAGTDGRREYTLMGAKVNLAARLMQAVGKTEGHGVYIDEETYAKAHACCCGDEMLLW